jgi:hypothetical protein
MTAVFQGVAGHDNDQNCQAITTLILLTAGMTYAYFKEKTIRFQKGHIMDMNNIGKFEMLKIVNEFDATLIRLYGVNMLDAAINRFEALIAYDEFHCPRKAAEIYGQRHGLNLQLV